MVYVWKCSNCSFETEVQRPMSECTVPPEDECPLGPHAPDGITVWLRVYTPAMISKASYPDGVRKFTEFREASKLQRESNKTGDKKRKAEIAAEIRKLGVRVSK